MVNSTLAYFPGRDGARLAYRVVGAGRPLVLLSGAAGDSTMWEHYGLAEAFAALGRRVLMPDFRGHGRSAKPQDVAAYPPDVLTDDALAFVDHLGLVDYDLGGYSLGGRIVVRMMVRGATPARAFVGGQGLREVSRGVAGGAGVQLRKMAAGWGTGAPGSEQERSERWARESGLDPVAMVHVLDSLVATPAERVGGVEVPTLVVVGRDDPRAASAAELVDALPQATLVEVAGDHGTAPAAPEFATAVGQFLAGQPVGR
ncbi:alpha/beta fold hydrolase [Pseudofrankia sp. BMG5.37]|uniref:alpha/beta fold hydrolase n=1 Tax=Pseudofrankia sp. BMG5.37 TaxID=3050035 RepID=UPI002894AA04|nr:alpha/beta fold hydrolase [Pseudofrankia sp. BMG5.37]MDT3443560.1 alpha/beta fold hydrolase [Pseudofrankia sp. BMG5.37]